MVTINKRSIRLAIFSLILASGTMACFGVNQITQIPQPTIPVNPSPPSDTPLPAASPTTILIPLDTPIGVTPTSVSTEIPPATGQINILEINGFKDDGDYWYFYGLVRNDTNRTISDLQVEVQLLDVTGGVVYSYVTYSMLNNLVPGESTPFSDFTTEPFPDGKTMQATVDGYNSTVAIQRAYIEFRGITTWVDEYNDVYLAGEVFNGNADPVDIHAIAGKLSDENGNLVTASYAYPFLDYIEPDGSGPFVMRFDAPVGEAGKLTNYSITSDALVTHPISPYALSISDTQLPYRDMHGDFHLVGYLSNNASEPMNISLLAGAYDENGNCIDASSSYVPDFIIPLNPGESLPYDFTMWGALDLVPEAGESAYKFRVLINWLSTYVASAPAFELSTKDDTHSFDGGVGIFNGTVINNSGQDMSSVIVTVSIYNASTGELLATNKSFVPEILLNNGTGSYEVFLYPPEEINLQNINVVITASGQ